MIVTSKVGAQVTLDEGTVALAGVDVRQAAASKLARMIVAEGENIGAFIRPTSVWITERRIEDPAGMGVVIDGRWCPDPVGGVEFHGGPADGEVRPVPRDPLGNGGPVLRIRVEVDARVVFSDAVAFPPRRYAEYRRAGIDSVTDRWVYEYLGAG